MSSCARPLSPGLLKVAALCVAMTSHFPAAGIEVLVPPPGSVLRTGEILIIGHAAEDGGGELTWPGGNTSFQVQGGRFSAATTLATGDNRVRLVRGSETTELVWTVQPEALFGTYEYHPSLQEGRCAVCHDPYAPPPAGENVATSCYECHTSFLGRQRVHAPVSKGLCAACHDPHGSVEPALLRFTTEELCSYCHNQPVTESHRSQAGDAPCARCHDPHGSNRDHLLKTR